jgi:small subunit ribosomal protein S4
MSRYTGPRVKKMRAVGIELPGLSPKKIERRPYPPGQHGQGRKKPTEFAIRLKEKQKIRLNYGLGEVQLRRLMVESRGSDIAAGAKLIELLERRLDNVVFRAGFARTIPQARQMVNHGHVLINGKRVDIPSYRVNVGEVIVLKDRKKVQGAAGPARTDLQTPAWLEVKAAENTAQVTQLPDDTSIPFEINVQLVVEYYSQRL